MGADGRGGERRQRHWPSLLRRLNCDMPISRYLADLRSRVGTALLLTPGVLAIIRDDARRVLVQCRSDNGAWVIPGGCTDPGEPPARALVREVAEETGLLVRPTKLLAVAGG